MSGYSIHHREFARLLDSPMETVPTVLGNAVDRIGRAGIHILFPPRPVANFMALIAAEMTLKRDFLSARQPVHHLRLTGFPLRQITVEQITELLFRLCNRYQLQDADKGERRLDLTLDQCSQDHLALLKGLGFSHLRLRMEASIAGASRSLDGLEAALAAVRHFSCFRVSTEVVFSTDTSPAFLRRVAALLSRRQVEEVEFCHNGGHLTLPEDREASEQTFGVLADTLGRAGYRLVGDRCFKGENHRDLQLLSAGKLAYGPWGFCDRAVSEWLALGPGAGGMIAGYLYHNEQDPAAYAAAVEAGKSPVHAWSRHPMTEALAFRFIQDIYCRHRVPLSYFRDRPSLLARLGERQWLETRGDDCVLTGAGILHLPAICNLFALHGALAQAGAAIPSHAD